MTPTVPNKPAKLPGKPSARAACRPICPPQPRTGTTRQDAGSGTCNREPGLEWQGLAPAGRIGAGRPPASASTGDGPVGASARTAPGRRAARLGLLGAACLTAAAAVAPAADIHVAPGGRDDHPGTKEQPLATLAAARDAARRIASREPVVVRVADGVYHLPGPLVLGPADSGTAAAPVVYQAERGGGAVLSGGLALDAKWTLHRDAILKTATPPGLAIDQLFVGGKRQRMARYPNFDPNRPTAAWQGFAADAFAPERAARWENPAGGFIHAMHVGRWGGYHYRITGKNPDGTVAYEGGWQNNRQMGMHKEFRMVENIFEELDAPGEWFHDAPHNTLYLVPEPGTDPAATTVEVVRLPRLVEFAGTRAKPVRHITLRGFVFRHAARTFMDTREPLLRSDWAIHRGGALVLTGSEDLSILDCEIDQPGGNGIFVDGYNRRTLVKGCHIHDTGASGVCFVGDPAAVRDPLFEYGQSQDLAKIDRAPGPKTDDYPADCTVEDCLIHGIGRVERQPAGVQISMARRITVRDTTIHDCARAGINIGDGTWGGHLIERVDVFDTVLETHDHGSFNSWGRDRYWTSRHREVSEPAVRADPKLPFLDAVETTVIRDSRWRCDHGWDIDLDDGSSNYDIYQNLLLAGGLKFREGYRRRAWNNVIVNNGFHPHVWFADSGDEFHSNILMRPHAPIGMPAGWGKGVDRNLFSAEPDRARHLAAGCDAHSLTGEPGFLDPARGDFRVKDDSPALQLGFRNFPMDCFGVKKPALRALAGSPQMPVPAAGAAPDGPAPASPGPRFWLGARLHGLAGEEFSAFGVTKEDGGVQLAEVPAHSAAARAGLRGNDLIQSLNRRKVSNTADLFAALATAGDARLELRVVRNQQAAPLVLTPPAFTRVETAAAADAFRSLAPPAARPGTLTTSRPTHNDPPAILLDGKLAAGYGPVFANGTTGGAYLLDLGALREVVAVTAWSFNQGGCRARQNLTAFGAATATAPGWDTTDRARFEPLGTIDSGDPAGKPFVAASLRARDGTTLGRFRWILWQVEPVTGLGEHTAFQELAVDWRP